MATNNTCGKAPLERGASSTAATCKRCGKVGRREQTTTPFGTVTTYTCPSHGWIHLQEA